MNGLRKRVTVGFMSIVGVLVLSGMVSFIELSTLSNDTEDILGINRQNRELASEMLTAVRNQNRAFVQMSAFGDRSLDSLCESSLDRLDDVLIEAKNGSLTPEIVDSMIVTAKQLRYTSERFMATPTFGEKYDKLLLEFPQLDSLSKSFQYSIFTEYQPIYLKMVTLIDNYMTMSQNSLAPGAEQLQSNAYRAMTPVFISLVVMIATVLMLFYFMIIYCVNPVIAINQSLKDYLSFKVPYSPKSQNKDEIAQLSERIETLITQNKKLNKE
ncbi:MAG: hypothetical protein SNH55_08135 [Rikenellaceae bacterium]